MVTRCSPCPVAAARKNGCGRKAVIGSRARLSPQTKLPSACIGLGSDTKLALNSVASPKRCKNASVVAAQAAVSPCKFLHKAKITQLDDESALIGVEEAVDFRLADRLLRAAVRIRVKNIEKWGFTQPCATSRPR